MNRVLPKTELRQIVKRLLLDPNNGISDRLFADLCGIHERTLLRVFVSQELPLTENVQRRASRAYERYRKGEIAIFKNRDNTRYVTFRAEPKPRFAKSNKVVFENGQVKLKVGIINRLDYSRSTLEEQLKGDKNG